MNKEGRCEKKKADRYMREEGEEKRSDTGKTKQG
jgi:hypothetical protein